MNRGVERARLTNWKGGALYKHHYAKCEKCNVAGSSGTWCQWLIVLFGWQVSPGSSWEPEPLTCLAGATSSDSGLDYRMDQLGGSIPPRSHISFQWTHAQMTSLYLTLAGLGQESFLPLTQGCLVRRGKWIQGVYWVLEHWEKNLNREKEKEEVKERRAEWSERIKERGKDRKRKWREKKINIKRMNLCTQEDFFF